MFGSKDKEKERSRPAESSTPRAAATSETKPAPAAPAPATPAASAERTVLGQGAKFTGTMNVNGSLVIDGVFEGTLECSDTLIVGKNGKVKAEINVREAQVSGRVEGVIHATERVELEAGSHLEGDIHAKSFMIQDGVFFQGNCSMGQVTQGTSKKAETAPELGILKQS